MRARALLPVMALLSLASLYLAFGAQAILYFEDQALTAMVAEKIVRGDGVILGPPSHIGGRHLGPWYYYIQAGFRWFGGEWLLAYQLEAIGKGVILLFALFAFFRLNGADWKVPTLLFFITCSATEYRMLLYQPWHGNFTAVFSALLWVAFAALLKWRRSAFPLFLFVSAVSIQQHYSFIPLVCIMTLAFGAQNRFSSATRASGPPKIFSMPFQFAYCAGALLSWIPLLAFELKYGGNTGLVLSGLFREKLGAGLGEALWTFATLMVRYTIPSDIHYVPRWASLLILGGFGLLFVSKINREKLEAGYSGSSWFYACGIAASLVYIILISRQTAPLHRYYLYPVFGFLFLTSLMWGTRVINAVGRSGGAASSVGIGLLASYTLLWAVPTVKYIIEPDKTDVSPCHSLRIAKPLGNTLGSEVGKAELLVLGEKSVPLRDGLLFFMGERFWKHLKWTESFKELRWKEIEERRGKDSGVYVSCPYPSAEVRGEVVQDLKKTWTTVTFLNLKPCGKECRGVMALKLTR